MSALAWHSLGSDPLSREGAWEGGFQPREQSSFSSQPWTDLPRGSVPASLPHAECFSHQHLDVCTRACVTSLHRSAPLPVPCYPPTTQDRGGGAGEAGEDRRRQGRPRWPRDDCGRGGSCVFPAPRGWFSASCSSGARGLLGKWAEGGRKLFLSLQTSAPEAKRHHISFQKSLPAASPFSSLRAHCLCRLFFPHSRCPRRAGCHPVRGP